jgi:hypothetical protein
MVGWAFLLSWSEVGQKKPSTNIFDRSEKIRRTDPVFYTGLFRSNPELVKQTTKFIKLKFFLSYT